MEGNGFRPLRQHDLLVRIDHDQFEIVPPDTPSSPSVGDHQAQAPAGLACLRLFYVDRQIGSVVSRFGVVGQHFVHRIGDVEDVAVRHRRCSPSDGGRPQLGVSRLEIFGDILVAESARCTARSTPRRACLVERHYLVGLFPESSHLSLLPRRVARFEQLIEQSDSSSSVFIISASTWSTSDSSRPRSSQVRSRCSSAD